MSDRDRITARLLREGESAKVEFVSSPDNQEPIAQGVCALLNTKGGVVLVGVDDDGTPNGSADESAADQLREFLHDCITPQVLFTVSLDSTDNGDVISIDIPEGSDGPYLFKGTVYLRRGASVRHADAQQLREMVEKSFADTERWERRPSTGFELKDLDTRLLDETVRRAQDRRGYKFENPKDRGSVLSDLALLHFGQLTNAADVLFGRRASVRHPQTRVRCVFYESDRSADNFLDEQLFEGPAFLLLEDAMAFLKRHIPISSEFREGELARDSKPKYPFHSLREGLVNALVHREYSAFSGSISVSIYSDRVELWNTGKLPRGLSPRDLLAPSHDSILVNPDICHVFYLHELMERVGRGTYKIVQQCQQMGMPLPEWRNVSSGVRLTLFATKPGAKGKPYLNERQTSLLGSLKPGERITIRDYIDQCDVSERTARRDISELEAFGLLERYGAGPSTAYERTNIG